MADVTEIREAVRERYAQAAVDQAEAGCCAAAFGGGLYGDEAADAPPSAVAASLGCGVPTAVADLRPGEVVLDLGSGAGADVLIAARRVAPTGRAIGLEAARVLRPGGRFAVSDVIADAAIADATRADIAAWTGCIAGALTESDFRGALERAGLEKIEIRETHRVHERAGAAIIRAEKPPAPTCCEPAALTTCCEPAAKDDCCTPTAGGPPADCGCRS